MEMISLNDISFSYNGKLVLDGIDHVFPRGSITAVMGPNGSGKTTLIRLMNGILKPLQGTISVNGRQLKHIKSSALAQQMAYVPQMQLNVFPATVFDTVLLGRKPYIRWNPGSRDKEFTSSLLVKLGLEDIALKDINRLSSGQRQRVFIARALAQEPDIILLDEPTANLDLKHQHEVMRLLSQLSQAGITIIIAIHDLNLALKYCGEFMILNEGRMVDVGTRDIFTEQMIEQVYGVRTKILKEGEDLFILTIDSLQQSKN